MHNDTGLNLNLETQLLLAVNAAINAGEAVMNVYKKDFTIELKSDDSPLTEADKVSNQVIRFFLKNNFPVLSEEGKSINYEERKNWSVFWMVDPLDGTKEFINKNGEFTVNIALIKKGKPVLGVVYVPVPSALYFGSENAGSFKCHIEQRGEFENIDVLLNISEKLKGDHLPAKYSIVASRSHPSPETEHFITQCKAEHGEVELISKGSSIKFCLVAEGKAHIYPRLAPTMEWDTAAAHAIAKFAGCRVVDFNTGEELEYNKESLLNPHFLVVR